MADENVAKMLPFPGSEGQSWLSAKFDNVASELRYLTRMVEQGNEDIRKVLADHEQRLREGERERRDAERELSNANVKIARLEAERQAAEARSQAALAEVKAAITAIETKLDAVTARQLSLWQQIIVKTLPVLLGVGGGGGLVVGFMELVK